VPIQNAEIAARLDQEAELPDSFHVLRQRLKRQRLY
jgi:hypothetical protein